MQLSCEGELETGCLQVTFRSLWLQGEEGRERERERNVRTPLPFSPLITITATCQDSKILGMDQQAAAKSSKAGQKTRTFPSRTHGQSQGHCGRPGAGFGQSGQGRIKGFCKRRGNVAEG